MATQPKSKAVEGYRRQIAAYLAEVREATGWKLVQMGERAGGLKHTTIGRALKLENTLGFPALLALEAASGVRIPDDLRGAAIAAQNANYFGSAAAPTQEEIRKIAAELQKKPPEYQQALLEELRRSLAKAR